MMTLREAFDKRHRGAMIKHDHFFDIYDSHLSYRQSDEMKVLEIGVYNGGSLYMWRNYFPNSSIVGVDIDPFTKRWEEKDKNIKIYIGDQCDTEFLQKVCDEEGPFDLIIDDGGHENNQIITSLEFLFQHLKIGGTYVVEDTFASYWPNYSCDRGKGTMGENLNPILKPFDKKSTSMEFLKSITDSLNVWAYRSEEAGEFKKNGSLNQYEMYLHSVHFYDSIVFINKQKRNNDKSFGEDKWYEHKLGQNAEFTYDKITGENSFGYKEN